MRIVPKETSSKWVHCCLDTASNQTVHFSCLPARTLQEGKQVTYHLEIDSFSPNNQSRQLRILPAKWITTNTKRIQHFPLAASQSNPGDYPESWHQSTNCPDMQTTNHRKDAPASWHQNKAAMSYPTGEHTDSWPEEYQPILQRCNSASLKFISTADAFTFFNSLK